MSSINSNTNVPGNGTLVRPSITQIEAMAPDASFFSDFVKTYQAAAQVSTSSAAGTMNVPSLSVQNTDDLGNTPTYYNMTQWSVDQDEQSQFMAILDKAYTTGAMSDPKAFLQSLSSSDLTVLQQVHNLSDPIDVNSISTEGAYNLLLPTSKAVDFNNDGIIDIGDSENICFPPVNAPESVVSAWDHATAGMSAEDRVWASAPFTPAILKDGSLYDTKTFDPTNVNDYKNVINNYLDFLKNPDMALGAGQYQRDFPLYTELKNLLNA